jgi:4-hydroxy 2-oxovalerate aldolase
MPRVLASRWTSAAGWGPSVSYNITGQMNLHPRAAIQFLASADRDNYLKFYDQVAIDA